MKVTALEEHYCPAEVLQAWKDLPADLQDPGMSLFEGGEAEQLLQDLGEARLKRMDEMGIDVQVLSLTTPATQILEASEAVRLARRSNDLAARAVAAHPDRFQAFATLPTPDPNQAVRELERCVSELGMKGAMLTGRTGDIPLDAPRFLPVFEAAARLKAPLYLHPQIPLKAVRDIYYTGFGDTLDAIFAAGGWGWHADTGIQALRLILSGLFDRLPALQLILGHWGEVILFYLDRIGPAFARGATGKLQRPIDEYIKSNFYVTPSGILSQRYLRNAIEIMGVDRVMFSVDYPFVTVPDAPKFLADSGLTATEQEKIATGNWNRLTHAA